MSKNVAGIKIVSALNRAQEKIKRRSCSKKERAFLYFYYILVLCFTFISSNLIIKELYVDIDRLRFIKIWWEMKGDRLKNG